MISALFKALGQLGDRRLNWVLWAGLLGAVAVFVLLWYVWFRVVSATAFFENSWLEFLADAVSGVGVVLATIFLFPAVVTLVAGALLEYVARAVEAKHYPQNPPPRDQPISEIVLYLVKFTGLVVLLNLIALPFYLLVPFLNFMLFWALNGYLLGREYFEMVAMRRMTEAEARAFRRSRRGGVFMAGLVIAVLMTVPLVNLLMPVVATAFMVHIFEGMRRTA